MQEISAKRQVDLLTAAHKALVNRLRSDKEFAERYPTLKLQLYRNGNEVGLRVGTRRKGSKAEYNWENIRVVLQLDQGVVPPDIRRAAALWTTHDFLVTVLVPKLLATLPNVTRKDVVTLLNDAWPSSRGSRSTPLFDPRLVRATFEALAKENPSWGARAIREDVAKHLNVSPRTIANLTRNKS